MSRELRIRINETMDEQISVVKTHYGLVNDSELVRFLITKSYNEVIEKARLLEQFKKSNEPQGVVN
jgi:hypothetical protein